MAIALISEDSSPRIRCPQLRRWLQPSIRSHKDALRQFEMIFASINHLHLSWPAALTHISGAKVPGTAPLCPFKMASSATKLELNMLNRQDSHNTLPKRRSPPHSIQHHPVSLHCFSQCSILPPFQREVSAALDRRQDLPPWEGSVAGEISQLWQVSQTQLASGNGAVAGEATRLGATVPWEGRSWCNGPG
jgi:hypothetical protein